MSGIELGERINTILDKKSITKKQFYSDLELPNNTSTKWTSGSLPNSTTLFKIADYLGVSMEYLLTGESKDYSLEDTILLESFHSLKTEYQTLIINNINYLKEL